jgi:RluA family pseudouridine synthase
VIAAPRVLHEDAEVLILDKPAGLAVHRGPRGGPSLEDWLPALRGGKRHLPQPAHRLDAETAGCLALGRTRPALAALGRLFAAGQAEKTYWAVLRGELADDQGEVSAPLAKTSTRAEGWRMVVRPDGQPARTLWRVIGRAPGLTAVELVPRTGRTHQLRVHMAHLGAPILGDARYGGGEGALHLLARRLVLPLEPVRRAEAPIPAHIQAALARCGVR